LVPIALSFKGLKIGPVIAQFVVRIKDRCKEANWRN
jgi:hypothetical protein